jgi:hypothetical protein
MFNFICVSIEILRINIQLANVFCFIFIIDNGVEKYDIIKNTFRVFLINNLYLMIMRDA